MTQHLYERYGLASSVRPSALEPAVDLVLCEERRLPPPAYLPLIDIYPPTAASFPSGEPVIDLRGLSRLR
jgi:hypothetical protein